MTADEIEAAFQKSGRLGWRPPLRSRLLRQKFFSDFQTRVWAATDRLLDTTDESIALVAHLGVLRLIYQHLVDREAVLEH